MSREKLTPTYSRCTRCGWREEGVCALMFGHKCKDCGAVDAAKIIRRRRTDA